LAFLANGSKDLHEFVPAFTSAEALGHWNLVVGDCEMNAEQTAAAVRNDNQPSGVGES
jgi:hypothetical protein